jgi:hypothetical protein
MFYSREYKNLSNIYTTLVLEGTKKTIEAGSSDFAKEKITPENWQKVYTKLEAARKYLFDHHVEFALMLNHLSTVLDYTVPHMGVDDDDNIYINPESVMMNLSFLEVVGVLAHEVYHVMNLTFYRGIGRDHLLWNYATDFIMNRELLEQGFSLPDWCCLPKKENGRWMVVGFTDEPIDITDPADAPFLYSKFLEQQHKDEQNQPPQDDKKQPPKPPEEAQVGSIIYDEASGQYGKVTNVDSSGGIDFDPIPEDQVEQALNEMEGNGDYI